MTSSEPIAVVSMGCRFPGNVSTPSEYWSFLISGQSGRCRIPSSRFNVDAFAGLVETEYGYFIQEDVMAFDPQFFGISPLEAESMDPQQRKLLEVTYEVLENAGETLQSIAGTRTGVYVGNFTTEWNELVSKDVVGAPTHINTGGRATMLSNRLNHVFHLNGPSMTIDTACSSSMNALHLACTALQVGDCVGALVCGANLILTPDIFINGAKMGVLSKTGMCHTFDEAADGYARADGIGAIYIKKLSDALRDGNPIRAVIRSTAVNANDYAHPIVRPYGPSQEACIRHAYARANISDLSMTGYFENHGTGTSAGDSTEVDAIRRVFGRGRSAEDPLLIGSVKTQLGHSEAASGMASLMKVILSLENGVIPPTIGINKLNPKIEFSGLEVVQKSTVWSHKQIRRASVASFGYGGSGAHALLESVDSVIPGFSSRHCVASHIALTLAQECQTTHAYETSLDRLTTSKRPYIYPFSANNASSLERLAKAVLENAVSYRQKDLLYTLVCRKSTFAHRAFAIGNPPAPGMWSPPRQSGLKPSAIFVFSGQGSVWPSAATDILTTFPVFASTISEIDSILSQLPQDAPDWTIAETLQQPSKKPLLDPRVAQPVSTAVQIALADLLRSWNIKPAAVIGHSSGEIAAAYAAGHISKKQAMIASYYRGDVVGSSKGGAMLAVGFGPAEVQTHLSPWLISGEITIACYNSPHAVVLSGKEVVISTIERALKDSGVYARALHTGAAYHSPAMEAFGEEYEVKSTPAFSSYALPSREYIPMLSTVTGKVVSKEGDINMAYFRRNLVSPVQFQDAIAALLSEQGTGHADNAYFVEIGLHKVLGGSLRECTAASSSRAFYYSASLSNHRNSIESMLELAGNLWMSGYPVDLAQVNQLDPKKDDLKVCVDLPRYPWHYDHGMALCYENRWSKNWRFNPYRRNEILGTRVPALAPTVSMWDNWLSLRALPWLKDHKLGSEVVFPGACFCLMAAEAARQASGICPNDGSGTSAAIRLIDAKFIKALTVPEKGKVEITTTLTPASSKGYGGASAQFRVVIHSVDSSNSRWTEHFTAIVDSRLVSSLVTTERDTENLQEKVGLRSWYEKFGEHGLHYGSAFQCLGDVRCNPRSLEATGSLLPLKEKMHGRYLIHPAQLDDCMRLGSIASNGGQSERLENAYIPFSIEEAIFYFTPEPSNEDRLTSGPLLRAYSCGKSVDRRTANSDTEIYDAEGNLYISIKNLQVRRADGLATSIAIKDSHNADSFCRYAWKPNLDMMSWEGIYSTTARFKSRVIEQLVELIAHGNPGINLIELGSQDQCGPTAKILEVLQASKSTKRYNSYTFAGCSLSGTTSDSGSVVFRPIDLKKKPSEQGFVLENYDVAIVNYDDSLDISNFLRACQVLLKPNGYLLILNRGQAIRQSDILTKHFRGWFSIPVTSEESVAVARRISKPAEIPVLAPQDVHIVHRSQPVLLAAVLEARFSQEGWRTTHSSLVDLNLSSFDRNGHVVVVAELEGPMMTNLSEGEFAATQRLAESSFSVFWMTRGSLMGGVEPEPELSLMSGCARAIRSETNVPLCTVDVDEMTKEKEIADMIVMGISKVRRGELRKAGYEFMLKRGAIYTPQVCPDYALNAANRDSVKPVTRMASSGAFKLGLDYLGSSKRDVLAIVEDQAKLENSLTHDEVEIRVTACSLYGADANRIKAELNEGHDNASQALAGVIIKTGEKVHSLSPGDRVVALGAGCFDSHVRTLSRHCIVLKDSENPNDMLAALLPSMTALYALIEVGRLEEGEHVLVLGSFPKDLIVAIAQIAAMRNAKTTIADGSEGEKTDLDRLELHGIQEQAHLLNFSNINATLHEAVEIVMYAPESQTIDQNTISDCLAPFGRIIEICDSEFALSEAPIPLRSQSSSFSRFSTRNLFSAKTRMTQRLLTQAVNLVRSGDIAAKPANIYALPRIEDALDPDLRLRKERAVLTYENLNEEIKVVQAKAKPQFRADATYLLVGALGGLGRSLITWMFQHGAKNFVFLARNSSIQNPAAVVLVSDLRNAGVSVEVVEGDVMNLEDVKRAAKAAKAPIKGIVHAAMVLRDVLFSRMTLDQWNAVLGPKVKGTQNLLEVFKKTSLEFFVMTSSISGILGTPGQANYCAANSFLDSVARKYHASNISARSIALGPVRGIGYIHEHDSIEKGMRRDGVFALSEKEFLDAMWTAMQSQEHNQIQNAYEDSDAKAVLVTGIQESTGGQRDMRFALLDNRKSSLHQQQKKDPLHGSRRTLSVSDVKDLVVAKLSEVLLLPPVEVGKTVTMSELGLDSLISVELRSWAQEAFGVEIPILELLNSSLTLDSLSSRILALRNLKESD